MTVTGKISQPGLFFVRQHDHATIEIQSLFHKTGNRFQQFVNIEYIGGRLADFLHEQCVVVPEVALDDTVVGGFFLSFDGFDKTLFFKIFNIQRKHQNGGGTGECNHT